MDSLEALISKYENFIKKKSRFYGRDYAEADELSQKTFIVLWRNHHKLLNMNEQSIKAFLSAAIKNALIDLRRKEKKLTSYDVMENQMMHKSEDWENGIVNNIHIMTVMHKLSSEEQDIVFKTYFMRMTSVEIGNQLSMTPSTIRSKLMRANRKLKKFMSDVE